MDPVFTTRMFPLGAFPLIFSILAILKLSIICYKNGIFGKKNNCFMKNLTQESDCF